jgi:hypothetical protein
MADVRPLTSPNQGRKEPCGLSGAALVWVGCFGAHDDGGPLGGRLRARNVKKRPPQNDPKQGTTFLDHHELPMRGGLSPDFSGNPTVNVPNRRCAMAAPPVLLARCASQLQEPAWQCWRGGGAAPGARGTAN